MTLILASQSPRRQQILNEAGLKFIIAPAHIDESVLAGESPAEHVQRLAAEKARAIALSLSRPQTLILAADTVVVLNNKILGKPLNDDDAKNMLKKLSSQTHEVLTGWTLIDENGKTRSGGVESSKVRFRVLSEQEIEDYVKSGEPQDKAGAYGIQGKASKFVENVEGLVSNVIGLPIEVILPHLNIAKPHSNQV